MTYYQIDGKVYYLNIDNLFSIVSDTPQKERPISTTITQVYGDNDEIEGNAKEIVESKSNFNETMNNVRYDMLKNLITCLLTTTIDTEGAILRVTHLKDMTFAQGLCFNTLIEYNILSEVDTNE